MGLGRYSIYFFKPGGASGAPDLFRDVHRPLAVVILLIKQNPYLVAQVFPEQVYQTHGLGSNSYMDDILFGRVSCVQQVLATVYFPVDELFGRIKESVSY